MSISFNTICSEEGRKLGDEVACVMPGLNKLLISMRKRDAHSAERQELALKKLIIFARFSEAISIWCLDNEGVVLL